MTLNTLPCTVIRDAATRGWSVSVLAARPRFCCIKTRAWMSSRRESCRDRSLVGRSVRAPRTIRAQRRRDAYRPVRASGLAPASRANWQFLPAMKTACRPIRIRSRTTSTRVSCGVRAHTSSVHRSRVDVLHGFTWVARAAGSHRK